MEQILSEIQSLPTLEWIATITAIIYVILAARENIWCWIFGIISCGLWAFITFESYQLYLDAGLNIFYVAMGFYGIYQWKNGAANQTELEISRMIAADHVKILLVGTIVALFFGYFFDAYTPAAATYIDALTTVFAIVATYLTVQKKLENWLYWIVIDLVYVYLYLTRGAYLFALVYLVYTVVAVSGYFQWKRKIR